MDNNLYALVSDMDGKDAFVLFLRELADNYCGKHDEWKNITVPEFLKSVSGWINDFSRCSLSDIDWDGLDYKTLACLLYMGKVYGRYVLA